MNIVMRLARAGERVGARREQVAPEAWVELFDANQAGLALTPEGTMIGHTRLHSLLMSFLESSPESLRGIPFSMAQFRAIHAYAWSWAKVRGLFLPVVGDALDQS